MEDDRFFLMDEQSHHVFVSAFSQKRKNIQTHSYKIGCSDSNWLTNHSLSFGCHNALFGIIFST